MRALFKNHHNVIYVCHPYGGNLENVLMHTNIMEFLDKRYHDKTFVSPIFCWGYKDYRHVGSSRKRDMRNCKRLLARCDAVLLTGKWLRSEGCVEEADYSLFIAKPIYELRDTTVLRVNPECLYERLSFFTK